MVTALVGFIQLAYWKYASGEWLVYSYEDQGFSWLKPHLYEGIFQLSFRLVGVLTIHGIFTNRFHISIQKR